MVTHRGGAGGTKVSGNVWKTDGDWWYKGLDLTILCTGCKHEASIHAAREPGRCLTSGEQCLCPAFSFSKPLPGVTYDWD
jgi:hypothetical protein